MSPVAEADERVDFARDIQPLFRNKCNNCHGEKEREGGLRLLQRSDILLPTDSGHVAVAPGQSAESILLQRVSSTNEEDRMPPEGTPLTSEQVDLIRRWIDEGAEWPDQQRERHWSYFAPVKAPLPKVSRPEWIQNEIDAFVLARLDAEADLKPSPPADPARLLRRVSLDLTGLPPTVEQVEAFGADPSREHFERIVDELLDSPRYGEKWARQWLDLARYADSNGFQADQFREIWAYRDWVINAMNADMPYTQFTIEQIAGDLIPEGTLQQRIATGFHRCTTCNVEAGVDPEENRTNQIIDRVNTTGMVWLGTSLECCQCHNHKYDPFTMQDYYQIFAFFNGTPLEVEGDGGVQFEVGGPKVELPLAPEQEQQRAVLNARQQALAVQLEARKQALESDLSEWMASQKGTSSQPPQWHVLPVAEATSTGGARFEQQSDGSLLVTGAAPSKDEYELIVDTRLQDISQFKLECLTDPTLPGNGPGRGDAQRPNFVLYEFAVDRWIAADESWEPVTFRSAEADFSQSNWPVAGLIDGKDNTGWAINPEFGKPHWATFLLADKISHEAETRFRIRLPQHFGNARTIGKLRISAMTGDPAGSAIAEEIAKLLATDFGTLTDKQRQQLLTYRTSEDAELAQLEQQHKQVSDELGKVQPSTSMVMVEMSVPRMTTIFKRGNFLDPGPEVQPTTPEILHALPHGDGKPATRLDFARWLVDPANPLAARVAVNRWWAEFFGQGIVATLEDFGSQGELPTHPELLDWLAVDFMENGWSMKHIHKQIVLSATYQQDSRISETARDRDPYNKLLARGPRVRMSAETIRDNALAVSGLLSAKMGGPPIYPPQPANIWRHVGRNAPKYDTDTDEDRFRRGIYVVWRRSAPYPSFVNFDAPDRGACVVQRSRTNTPLQALTLLNDPAYVEMALALSRQVLTHSGKTDQDRLDYALQRTLCRPASDSEVATLLEFLQTERQHYTGNAQSAEQIVPKTWRVTDVPLIDQAAWFEVANVLLNLDETITK